MTRSRMKWVWKVALGTILWGLGMGSPTLAASEPGASPLLEELARAGLEVLETGVLYGVPYVAVKMPLGESVTTLCRRVPSLNRDFFRARERIAFFNGVHPGYVRTASAEPFSLKAPSLKIPLHPEPAPEIFPPRDDSLAGFDKYLLIDLDKGFLALYRRGDLFRVFPISAGRPGKRTPVISFRILAKDRDHWSSLYDVWMPWALLIRPPYFIHAGVLPGEHDSAGCIRLFPRDAEELFHLVEVGTPGRIVHAGPKGRPAASPLLSTIPSPRNMP